MSTEPKESTVFLVWDADSYDDGDTADADAHEVPAKPDPAHKWPQQWAADEEDAAEIWADNFWSERDNPDTMSCVVRSPDGTVTRWKVVAEQTVVFSAAKEEA